MILEGEDFERSIFNRGLEMLHHGVREYCEFNFAHCVKEGIGISSGDINVVIHAILETYFVLADDAPDHERKIVRNMISDELVRMENA